MHIFSSSLQIRKCLNFQLIKRVRNQSNRRILGGPNRNTGEPPRNPEKNKGFLEDDVEKRNEDRLHSLKRRQNLLERNVDMVRCMSYKAQNEPVYSYENCSKERMALEAKLKEFKCQVHEVPIVIGDEEIKSGFSEKFQPRPFDHQSPLAKFYWATPSQITKAIDVSLDAHKCWEKRPIEERAEIFLRAGDLVAGKYRYDILAATILGQSKTIIQAEIDAACELADFFRFGAQWAIELHKWQPLSIDNSNNRMSYRSCEGFWAAISPFNFTAIGGNLSGAPALMGNTVVWKPSDSAILSSYICFKILREAGVPPGVINFVPADGPVFGSIITSNKNLIGINFTGSVPTFTKLWQDVAKNLNNFISFPRLIGECGGKNYHFVHPSADQENVINGTIQSSFEFGGQKCSACSRIYIPQSIWPCIKDSLCEEISKIKIGSPLIAENFLSSVIDKKAFDRIKSYIDYAKNSPDCKILCGGDCDDSKGYFIQPTFIVTKNPKDRLLQEEIFGPVLTAFVYEDNKIFETLNLINETTPYALTGSIYSADKKFLDEAAEVLRYSSGNFYINDKSTGSVVAQQPFGGARKSGTNDKAGSPHYLYKFVSPLSIKESSSKVIKQWDYPYMKN